MTTEDPLKNWQLENREQDAEQWKLQETEQDLNKHMQLQSGQPDAYWQPIEYTRNPQQPRGRNWVLPSVLIVALLAVLGYVGWIGYGQLSSGESFDLAALIPRLGSVQPTATPTSAPVAAAAAVTEEATPTLEPTPTSAPVETPTPTIEPTPTIAMAQLISGTVNAVGGVNARRDPAITGDLVELLSDGTQVVVTRQEGDWMQIILPNRTVAWVVAEFINTTSQPVPLAELAALYAEAGLPVPTPEAAATALLLAPTPAAGAEITGTNPLTGSLLGGGPPDLVPNGVIPGVPFTNTLPLLGPALTVTDTTGVNARSSPDTTGDPITVVPNGAVLPVIGRNPAGDWLQVQLPTGETGWMFAGAVVASPDAVNAPIVNEGGTGILTTTADTAGATPAVANVPDGATATVTNGLGANLRPAPSRDVDGVYTAAEGESFALIGRSGDGEWVQVVLPDGSSAWALGTTVSLSVDINTLPVTQP